MQVPVGLAAGHWPQKFSVDVDDERNEIRNGNKVLLPIVAWLLWGLRPHKFDLLLLGRLVCHLMPSLRR